MLMNLMSRLTHRAASAALAVFVFFFLAAPQALGQMGSSATYSESWVDGSDSNAVKIIGGGVTRDNYNTYGHTYWVTTTVRSPTGRTASATSYKSNAYSAYVRAETYLPWDWNVPDPGDYLTQSQHSFCCPYMGGNPYTGVGCPYSGTSTVINLQTKRASYHCHTESNIGGRYGYGFCDFEPTCTGICSEPPFRADKLYPGPCLSPYAECKVVYIGGVCLTAAKKCVELQRPGVCDQV